MGALATLAVAVCAAACGGSIGDGAGADGGVGGDGAAAADAALGPDAEVALGMFGTPTLIGALSDVNAADDDPSATDDLLELYFNSNRAGGLGGGDIWVSTRGSVSEPWGAPTLVAELSTADTETTPEILGDGRTIYFSRPGGLGGTDVFMSTRAGPGSAWATPELVPELSSANGDRSPTPSVDHLTMVIETNRPGGLGDNDLWEATRANVGDLWGTPAQLPVVNTAGSEGNGHWRDKDLFYNGNDPDLPGGQEIKVARRPSVQTGFQQPELIVELNSPESDSDPWLSPDLRTIYFTSNRSGDSELYQATR